MSLRSIKSSKKYVFSYLDSSNDRHQPWRYGRDSYDCHNLEREFNKYVYNHPSSVIRIQQKF